MFGLGIGVPLLPRWCGGRFWHRAHQLLPRLGICFGFGCLVSAAALYAAGYLRSQAFALVVVINRA